MNAGELRTEVRIQAYTTTGSGVNKKSVWADITEKPIRCKWYPLGGSEMWVADSQQIVDAANVITRYNTDITTACRLIKGDVTYKIIGVCDPDGHRHWLKFKVKAAMNA